MQSVPMVHLVWVRAKVRVRARVRVRAKVSSQCAPSSQLSSVAPRSSSWWLPLGSQSAPD